MPYPSRGRKWSVVPAERDEFLSYTIEDARNKLMPVVVVLLVLMACAIMVVVSDNSKKAL